MSARTRFERNTGADTTGLDKRQARRVMRRDTKTPIRSRPNEWVVQVRVVDPDTEAPVWRTELTTDRAAVALPFYADTAHAFKRLLLNGRVIDDTTSDQLELGTADVGAFEHELVTEPA